MIILLILFTLSFGVVFEKGNLYYSPEKVGDNGILIHNFKNYDDNLGFLKSQKITNFNQIVDNVTNTNTQFTSIPSEGFDDLKTTSALTQEERRCRAVLDSYNSGLFALYGYTAKAVEDADITPSITALIKSGPSQVQYLNVPSDYSQVFKDYNVTQQCNDEQYELSYGLSNKGVIDSQCIPNTDIPEDTSRCIGSGVEYQTHLKGFREGYFYYGDERMVKDLIIRFGVVISYPGVMIGWQYRKWIIVDYDSKGKYQLNSVDISASSYYEGTVLFNELNYHKDGISGGIIAVIIIVVVAVVGAALILFIILYLMYQRHRFANTTQNKDQNIDDKGNKQEIGKQQKDVGQSSTELIRKNVEQNQFAYKYASFGGHGLEDANLCRVGTSSI
ncbi:MAG: hypothetical protein EZS28_001666 [Streblomastix strix]|uniref:Uncharacterized protein n=1 Tax=Streblomastix strix TaxID=222440 RepID=A0A5J4X6F0_9EUKA|nr:MAG: hypothetical protein EZS28_001666 [Streblomastix strix]